MNNASKVESMLEFLCTEVHTVLCDNPVEANSYVQKVELFEGIRKIYEFAAEDNGKLKIVVSLVAMCDVFEVLLRSIMADGRIEGEEYAEAASLISESVHRYCWLGEYNQFEFILDGQDAEGLLRRWVKDDGWFGGDGGQYHRFGSFVSLACLISQSSKLYKVYRRAILLIAKLMLDVNGMASSEQAEYDKLSKQYDSIESSLSNIVSNSSDDASGGATNRNENVIDKSASPTPEESLAQGLSELTSLVGVDGVKAEVNRLTNFLKIRQQRIAQGLPIPVQSLHFVFTGNPGTGKTTVARIVAKILYGFRILKTPKLVEADRSSMVGGYVGQTAIKTSDVITEATDGVLFIDEAYTLSKGGGHGLDYGQEAIDTLLKKMEDLRDKLVVIAAGYPELMQGFVTSNPGLQSRFTRYIHFDDYHVSDLCQIFERMCTANAYTLTQDARANLAILFNRVFVSRDQAFGNARFVRNAYEKTLGNHSDRLCASDSVVTRDDLTTIHAADLPYEVVAGIDGPFDVSESRWGVQCPKCSNSATVRLALLGQSVSCKCGAVFICPWWNLVPGTVAGLVGFQRFERSVDLLGMEVGDRRC